jgi:hypothetical protein
MFCMEHIIGSSPNDGRVYVVEIVPLDLRIRRILLPGTISKHLLP